MELMHQSIPAAPSPRPGYCGAFACLFSPGDGMHLQILHFPVARHLPTPGLFPSFFKTHTQFPISIHRGYYWKKRWLAHLSRTGGCNWLMHNFLKKKKNFRFHLKKQHLAIKKKEKQSTTVLKPSKFGIEKRKPGQNFALSPPWPTIIYHFRSVDLPWWQSAPLPNSSRHHT